MKKLFLLLIALPLFIKAQEKVDESKFGIKFSGFVKSDLFYDTRQTVNIREGHFLLYPDAINNDINNKDINATPSFNMLSIQSRLKGAITGPNAFGAKTSGLIEADFFGNAGDENGFRLRHAFVKMNWKKTELLAGQYWHPLFVTDAFPEVISFNTGAPFQPFSRNPQLRLSHKLGPVKFIYTILSERDFAGTGPDGASTKYLRNSGFPEENLQIQLNPDSSEHLFGIGVNYKTIKPELFTADKTGKKKYGTTTTLSSSALFAFIKLKFKPITIKVYGVYAQNAYYLTMIGGYAVKEIIDTATGAKKFTNLNTLSTWMDIITNGKKIKTAIFVGYTKNLGSADVIKENIFYARGANIDNVLRVAPRIVFISGKLNIALEEEFTSAVYGKMNGNTKGQVTDGKSVNNFRTLIAFIYNF